MIIPALPSPGRRLASACAALALVSTVGLAPAPKAAKAATARKLTSKELRELEALPARIEGLEQEQATLTAKLSDPAFYKSEPGKFAEVKARLETIEREHGVAFARWEELEAARAG
jgi:ATP-binding cassette subfamily F protein uup